jgi:hypothetical protein
METTFDELKRQALAGDLKALQALRDRGFFQKKPPNKNGYAYQG